MNLINYINKHKYLIFSFFVLLLLIGLGSINYRSYLKIVFSIGFLFSSILYYFESIFFIESEVPYTVFDLIKEVNLGVGSFYPVLEPIPKFILPFNTELIGVYFKESFFMFFNIETFISYLNNFFSIFKYANLILLIIIFAISLKIFISSFSFNSLDPERIGYSKNFKRIEKFNHKYFHPIYIYFKNWIKYIKSNKFLISYILIILFYLNILGLILDIFSYFFIFSSNFKLSSIIECFISIIYILFPLFINIPLIIWIIIIYLIFNFLRKKEALIRLLRLEDNNMVFCETKLGIVNLFDGLMGGYKTSTITDFALTNSKIYRIKLADNLYYYRSLLPYFNFKELEIYVDNLANNKLCFNHVQIEAFLERRFNVGSHSLTNNRNKYYFGFDFNNYNDEIWDGIKKIRLEFILIEYAKNYFYYSCQNSFIYSNYPIKINEKIIKEGYYPEYLSKYFFINEDDYNLYINYSHCIDLNEIRIKKYFLNYEDFNNKELTSLLAFGVIAYSEAEKDLGNQNSNRIYDFKDNQANPTNDGTDLILKMVRHVCNLNFDSYIKFFLDMQRFGDLASKYKDISTSLIRCIKVDKKIVIKLWSLERIICEMVISYRKKVDFKMRTTRNTYGVIFYIFNKITYPFERYYNKIINKYSYKRLTLLVKGREEDVGEEYFYNLMNAKTFADTYKTDSHYALFKKVLRSSTKGIYSKDNYDSLVSTPELMKKQHSYFNEKLSELFNDEENNKMDGFDYEK